MYVQVVRRPYIFWYDNEQDSVERGLMNLAAAKVEVLGDLETVDDVSSGRSVRFHQRLRH